MHSYTDEDVPLEMGGRFGTYLRSYAAEDQRVEVHFFRTPTNRLTAFVTKAPTVAVAAAHAAIREAMELFTRSPDAEPSPLPPDVVYDGYSIGRSGSI